nr:PREDICTED: prominin-2 isoform X2 [Anolis carolinensis]|eukprot:XP_016846363.1 PREDICTED: prominin-2 isoform X2 [Anolis carolinensis]
MKPSPFATLRKEICNFHKSQDHSTTTSTMLWKSTHNNEHLHLAKYTTEFQKRLGRFQTRFEDIVLLNTEGRKDMETFRDSRIDLIDYPAFTAEMRNPMVRTNLEGLAGDLERLSTVQSDRTVAERLAEEAWKLKEIQNTMVLLMEGMVAKLKKSIHFLQPAS